MTIIRQAALDALDADEQAQQQQADAEREERRLLAVGLLDVLLAPAVDAEALDADVRDDVVLLTDGDVTLGVQDDGAVHVVREVDGEPTRVGEPVLTLADVARRLTA